MIKVYKFYADWCGPCKILAPRIEALKKKHPEVEWEDVNIEEKEQLTKSAGVMSVPTILVFNGEVEVGRYSGVVPDSAITKHFIVN